MLDMISTPFWTIEKLPVRAPRLPMLSPRIARKLPSASSASSASTDEIAALVVAEQRLAAVGCPLHRACRPCARPRPPAICSAKICTARAEVAADVADHQAAPCRRARRATIARSLVQAQGRAVAGVDRVFAGRRIVVADGRARLHRRAGDARHPGLELRDMRGARERGFGVAAASPTQASMQTFEP